MWPKNERIISVAKRRIPGVEGLLVLHERFHSLKMTKRRGKAQIVMRFSGLFHSPWWNFFQVRPQQDWQNCLTLNDAGRFPVSRERSKEAAAFLAGWHPCDEGIRWILIGGVSLCSGLFFSSEQTAPERVRHFSQERNLSPDWSQTLLSWSSAVVRALVTEIKTHQTQCNKAGVSNFFSSWRRMSSVGEAFMSPEAEDWFGLRNTVGNMLGLMAANIQQLSVSPLCLVTELKQHLSFCFPGQTSLLEICSLEMLVLGGGAENFLRLLHLQEGMTFVSPVLFCYHIFRKSSVSRHFKENGCSRASKIACDHLFSSVFFHILRGQHPQ